MGRKERRKEQKMKVFMSWVLAAIMVFSVAGIFLGQPSAPEGQEISYGDYEFVYYNNYYTTRIDGYDVRFLIGPYDVLNVDVPDEAMQTLIAAPVFVVTFEPSSEDVQAAEISKFQFETNLNKVVYGAVTEPTDVYTYPVVTCENATPEFPVISLESVNQTNILYENGCIRVQGTGVEMIKASERIIYGLVGII